MEERNLKVMFNSDGKGRYTHKLSLPKTWLEKMEVHFDDREVTVVFDEEKKEIIIRKLQNKKD